MPFLANCSPEVIERLSATKLSVLYARLIKENLVQNHQKEVRVLELIEKEEHRQYKADK